MEMNSTRPAQAAPVSRFRSATPIGPAPSLQGLYDFANKLGARISGRASTGQSVEQLRTGDTRLKRVPSPYALELVKPADLEKQAPIHEREVSDPTTYKRAEVACSILTGMQYATGGSLACVGTSVLCYGISATTDAKEMWEVFGLVSGVSTGVFYASQMLPKAYLSFLGYQPVRENDTNSLVPMPIG